VLGYATALQAELWREETKEALTSWQMAYWQKEAKETLTPWPTTQP
jgi:hypothetical protein